MVKKLRKILSRKNRKPKITNVLRVATMSTVAPVACQGGVDQLLVYSNETLIPILPNIATDDLLSTYFKNKFPSYSYCPTTNHLIMNDTDVTKFLNNPMEVVEEIAQAFNITEVEAGAKIFYHFKNPQKFTYPTGWTGVFHKLQLGIGSGVPAVQTLQTTAAAHSSGLTGFGLVKAYPLVCVIGAPTVGAIAFGLAERMFTNVPVIGPACGLTRDICLIPMGIVEVFWNRAILKNVPFVPDLHLRAPLNVTSYLRFGEGIREASAVPGFMPTLAKTLLDLIGKSKPN